ncbi:hypothetical protein F4703DRAFT_1790730 [Phycomyces blakesleeanus]|uniref:Uncharacterized protein n=1 Tax=Phycomyces blakesleeanus (strain ATCC 8743b / DSM 1359 / FGSC 10004 / NBRC 33097 / NRRL 1555) TaxID=763407 RepID=A0A167PBX5_PHYB8|nr:hypothetical protein PHYBLDRAFT_164527 [Phycomyces blakesleeanus NRRL 1555(-)]OAD77626.1 hypothetical protein PHYBLDRAFT_164527 [Phycomyces blakesleeanus NRRL 1555(-)]|eukprot:XP_018295666.1 hypothetical protein PHYBLDRAFT_164527 [Phycomyces blakesleeanus NRRL 1555(-)]
MYNNLLLGKTPTIAIFSGDTCGCSVCLVSQRDTCASKCIFGASNKFYSVVIGYQSSRHTPKPDNSLHQSFVIKVSSCENDKIFSTWHQSLIKSVTHILKMHFYTTPNRTPCRSSFSTYMEIFIKEKYVKENRHSVVPIFLRIRSASYTFWSQAANSLKSWLVFRLALWSYFPILSPNTCGQFCV